MRIQWLPKQLLAFRTLNRKRHGARTARCKLHSALEPLETRIMLSAEAWVGSAGGGDNQNWTDRLNWSAKVVPDEFTDVTIDTTNYTFSSGISVGHLTTTTGFKILADSVSVTGGMTVNGTVTLDGSTIFLAGGMLLNGTIDMGVSGTSSDALYFKGDQTISTTSSGKINMVDIGAELFSHFDTPGANVTIGPNVTIEGEGRIGAGGQGGSNILGIVNNGTIRAAHGTLLMFNNGTAINQGTLVGGPLGTLQIGGTLSSPGTITCEDQGIVRIGGTITDEPQLMIPSVGTINCDGTLIGTTINGPGTLHAKGGTLNGVTIAGSVAVESTTHIANGVTFAGGTLSVGSSILLVLDASQTFGGTGMVTLAQNSEITSAGGTPTLTLGSGVTLQGAGVVFVSLVNQGTVQASGGTLFFGADNNVTNSGTLTALASGTLGFGNDSSSNAGMLINSGIFSAQAEGIINLNENLTNTGTFEIAGVVNLLGTVIGTPGQTVLALDAMGVLNLNSTLLNGAPFTLVSGTIQNGTIDNTAVGKIVSDGGILDGVSLKGNLAIDTANAMLNIKNTLTLLGATIDIGQASAPTEIDTLGVLGAASIAGTGTINLLVATNSRIDSGETGASLTIGPNIVVQGMGDIGVHANLKLTNQGKIQATSGILNVHCQTNSGQLISTNATGVLSVGGALTNAGTIKAETGGNVSVIDLEQNTGSLTLVDAESQLTVDGFTSETLLDSGSINVDAGVLNSLRTVSIENQVQLNIAPAATLKVVNNLLGGAFQSSLFHPVGTVLFDTPNPVNGVQYLEAMSADQGAVTAGFVNNFAFETLTVSNTSLNLVDVSKNNPGSNVPDAVYVNTLNILAGSNLDLHGMHLYARTANIAGGVIGGSVTVVQNPVVITGTNVDIFGTSGNDTISFSAGATDTVTINGTAYPFDSTGLTTAVIHTAGGTDVVNLLSTNASLATSVTSSSPLTVNIGNAGNAQGILGSVTVVNSTAGSSVVNVDDSTDSTGRTVTFATTTPSGGSVSGSISGLVPAVIVYDYAGTAAANVKLGSGVNAEVFQAPASGGAALTVTGGGMNDVASFVAAGNDVFVGGANQGRLFNNSGYSASISGVGTVAAYEANSTDQANLDLRQAPNSTLVGTKGQTYAFAANFATYVFGFAPVYAYGKPADVAQLQAGKNDIVVGDPTSEYLAGTGYLIQTFGFGNAYAYGDASNVAQFYPGNGGTLVGTPTYGYITGPGYVDAAVGFGNVYAYGNSSNTAQLFPGAGGRMVGNSQMAYVFGTGYVDAAVGFGNVSAFGDSSNIAFLVPAVHDSFVATSGYAYVNGAGYADVALGFGNVQASGDATNTAFLFLDSNDQFVSKGGQNAYMTNSNNSRVDYAIGFGTVNAIAKDSTNVAFMYDSPADDTFYGRGSYAGLFGGGFVVAASGFGTVNAFSVYGGFDHLDINGLNYIFSEMGNWM